MIDRNVIFDKFGNMYTSLTSSFPRSEWQHESLVKVSEIARVKFSKTTTDEIAKVFVDASKDKNDMLN